MPPVAPTLALSVLLAALAPRSGAAFQEEAPAGLAARLLAASRADREQLLNDPRFSSVEVVQALLDAGHKEVANADYSRNLDALRTAEAIARRIGAERELARTLHATAEVFGVQGKLAPAQRLVEESLRIYERVGDLAGQAEEWNGIGNIKGNLAEIPAALDAYRKAYDLWSSAGDRTGVARALNNLGATHRVLADLDEALTAYEQALSVFESLGDRGRAAVVTNNIGLVHFDRGEYPEALDYCSRSLALQEALGDRYRIAVALNCLGSIHRAQGAYARALDVFHRALKLRQELGDLWGSLETWNNIGTVHFSQGEYRRAIDAYKRALRMNAQMGGNVQVAEGLQNIAAAAWRLGERPRAIANYHESLRVSERDGYKNIAAQNLHDLGRMALEEGRLAEAKGLLDRALAVREALKDQAGIAEALTGLASLDLAARRPEDALGRARRAAEIARAIEQPELRWEAETLSGKAYRRLGRLDDASRALNDALAVIEGLRLQVGGGEQRVESFFEGKLSPYRELLDLAAARGAAADALEIAERSKGRGLADLVRKGRVDVAGSMTDEERREEQGLQAALASANRSVQAERLKASPVAARLATLEAARDARRMAFETFQTAIYARHPDLQVRRGRAAPVTLAEAGPLIADPSVALLEYALTDENSYLFVLTREEGATAAKLDSYPLAAGRRSLTQRARRIHERLAARDLAFADDARQLYELLLAPARRQLEGKTHFVIVPDGALWEVPFQALQDGAGRYLIESAAVSYAPSLTVLRETLRRRPATARPASVLAMGKADFGAESAPPAIALMSELGPLPDAERQVRMIGEIYGPGRSTVYLGREAREDRFKAEAPRYSILHLATHGLLDESSPLYSHVVLSPGAVGSSEDGLLEAWEMMGLRLNADLVILSACETGRGRIAPGEGIVGTMWALFVAGSQAMLVSQWKVEAASTTELMTAFHRGLARGDVGKAAQLRKASLEVLRRPRYAHPFYWAGFVLVGNPY
jgi:CHAT domain-containing protein/Tfp pilus assembly protein PilF